MPFAWPSSIRFRQLTSIEPGPLYRVANSITQALGSSPAVFVFRTDTQAFSHYATAADMESWPDTRAQALTDSLMFYRLDSVTRDWLTVELFNADLAITKARLKGLAVDMSNQQAPIDGDNTVVISSES